MSGPLDYQMEEREKREGKGDSREKVEMTGESLPSVWLLEDYLKIKETSLKE